MGTASSIYFAIKIGVIVLPIAVAALLIYFLIKDQNYKTFIDMIQMIYAQVYESTSLQTIFDAMGSPSFLISMGLGLVLIGALFGGRTSGKKVDFFGVETTPIYPTASNWPGMLIMGGGAFLLFEGAITLRNQAVKKGS